MSHTKQLTALEEEQVAKGKLCSDCHEPIKGKCVHQPQLCDDCQEEKDVDYTLEWDSEIEIID